MNRSCALAFSLLTGASLWAGGYGVGLQAGFDLDANSSIVPRVDYLRLTDSSTVAGPMGGSIDLSTSVNSYCLGADYDYFFSGSTEKGVYVLGGLGVTRSDIKVTASYADASSRTTDRQTLLFPEVGAGYMFTPNLGLEVLYKVLRYKDVNLAVQGIAVGYSFQDSIQASLVVRF